MFDDNVKIRVKKKHIRNGTCGNPQYCAVALAIREQLPDAKYISVGDEDTLIDNKPMSAQGIRSAYASSYRYAMSRSAGRFIRKFDKKRSSVKPFTFIMKLSYASIK